MINRKILEETRNPEKSPNPVQKQPGMAGKQVHLRKSGRRPNLPNRENWRNCQSPVKTYWSSLKTRSLSGIWARPKSHAHLFFIWACQIEPWPIQVWLAPIWNPFLIFNSFGRNVAKYRISRILWGILELLMSGSCF